MTRSTNHTISKKRRAFFLLCSYFATAPTSGFTPVAPLSHYHQRHGQATLLPNKIMLSSTTVITPCPTPFIGEENEKKNDIDTIKKAPPTTIPKKKFLIHRGRSGAMIKRSPAIAGIGLCKGWHDDATQAFTKAVKKLVELNPILTGHVYESNRSGRNELRIESGTFYHNLDSYVKIVDASQSEGTIQKFSKLRQDPIELLNAVKEHGFPVLEDSELTSDQIRRHRPLFATTVVCLPNNYAIYAMKVSHAVGDGVTFMMLLKQLSLLMSGKDVPPIDWGHPQKETHELYPRDFSPHDIECMYGAPFMLGAAQNIIKQEVLKQKSSQRTANVLFFDKHKVNNKKKQLRVELDCPDLSANDVITAALCQSGASSDMFVFTENVRGSHKTNSDGGIPHNAADNFLVEIPVDKQTASNPDLLRRAIVEQQEQQNQSDSLKRREAKATKLPAKPFLDGKVARITSLATIPASLVYDGTEQLCTVPYLSFLSKLPLDTAMIFRFNAQYWGVLHNFAMLEPSPLLKELLQTDEDE